MTDGCRSGNERYWTSHGALASAAFMTVLLLAVTACASRPEDVLTPIAGAPAAGSHRVSMLVVSTRARSDKPGEVYSGQRAEDRSMTLIDVSVPPDHRVGHIEWPGRQGADPREDFATLSIRPVERPAALDWLDAQQTGGRVLLFVHGFNVPMDGAVYRLAQIVADAAPDAAPVLFTWPSMGSTFAYVYDRESAAYSRDALEEALRLAVESPRVTEITILAHSMGTWLVMEALRQYAIRDGRLDPKIHDVILASPDLDADVFRRQFEALGDDRPRFTFLIARDDRALMLSRLLAGGVSRIGAADVTREPYRSRLATTGGITVIDMTGLHTGDRTNHLDFARSPAAVIVTLAQALGRTIEAGDGAAAASSPPAH